MWLLEQLKTDFTLEEKEWCSNLASSCFISPPLGGFYEHETEIVGLGKTRPSLFGALWGQEGSVGAARPTDVPRKLKRWAGEIEPDATEDVHALPPVIEPNMHQLFWKTMLPPDSDEREEELYVKILRDLGYLSDDGLDTYWGPPYLEAEGWVKKRGQWVWFEDPQLEALRARPDEPEIPTDPNQHVLSRLHWKVLGHDPEHRPTTRRDKRRMRQTTTNHGYRRFKPWGPSCAVVRRQLVTKTF